MATIQIPILGATTLPDTSGDVYFSQLDIEMSLTNTKLQSCLVMEYPTGSDIGFELAFTVPQDYSGSPVLVIKGVLDGTPANVLAFGAQQLSRDDSEAVDTAYEAEDTASNSTWTGYADEDMYEETITLTPAAAYVAGDTVYLSFYRDDSADTTTFNFLLTDLLFQYSDA
jgi:hypothetical protein